MDDTTSRARTEVAIVILIASFFGAEKKNEDMLPSAQYWNKRPHTMTHYVEAGSREREMIRSVILIDADGHHQSTPCQQP